MRPLDAACAVFEEISVCFRLRRYPVAILTAASDDLTVEVIFFGNSQKTGDVMTNREASASINEVVKSKL